MTAAGGGKNGRDAGRFLDEPVIPPTQTPFEKWLARASPKDPSKPTRGHILAAMCAEPTRHSAYAVKGTRGWTPARRYPVDWAKGDPIPLPTPLSSYDLEGHLQGRRRIGLYLLREGSSLVIFGLVDLDDHGGTLGWPEILARARRIAAILDADGIAYRAVKSGGGKGIHLIPIWKTPQPARDVQFYLEGVVERAGLIVAAKADGIEVFPKQGTVEEGHFGNLVSLPYWKDTGDIDLATGEKLAAIPPLVLNEKVLPTAPPPEPRRPTTEIQDVDLLELRAALTAIPNGENGADSQEYDAYFRVIAGIHAASEGSDEGLFLADEWAAKSPLYWENPDFLEGKVWRYLNERPGGITAATIFKMAYDAGWNGGLHAPASAEDFDDLAAADDPGDPIIPPAEDPGDPVIPATRSLYEAAKEAAGELTQDTLPAFLDLLARSEPEINPAQLEELLKGVKERLGTSLAVLREMMVEARRKNRQAAAAEDGEDRWAAQHGLGEVLAFVANPGKPGYVFLKDHRIGTKGSVWAKGPISECLSPLNAMEEQPDGSQKEKPCFELWAKDPARVELRGLTLRPDLEPLAITPDREWNTWRGMVTQPVRNKALARIFRHFVWRFFSNPNETPAVRRQHRKAFLRWMAHLMQRPWIRQFTSWTFISDVEGIGKSMLLELPALIIGDSPGEGGGICGPEDLESPYTEYLEGRVYITFNEPSNDHDKMRAKTKALRTNRTVTINNKYGSKYTLPNTLNMTTSTNQAYAYGIAENARRDWVWGPHWLRTDADWMAEAARFGRLVGGDGPESEAFRSAVLWELQNVDLTDYDPYAAAGDSLAKGYAAEASLTVTQLVQQETLDRIVAEMGDVLCMAWTNEGWARWNGEGYKPERGVVDRRALHRALPKHGLRSQSTLLWIDGKPVRVWYVTRANCRAIAPDELRNFLQAKNCTDDSDTFPDLSEHNAEKRMLNS